MFTAVARAEGAGAAGQPYTWDSLATIGGATTATLLIVQYVKAPLDRWHHIPTRLITLIVAFAILSVARAYTVGLEWLDVPLILVNSFVVALAAMGAYEVSFAKLK
jgi:hypothetical protein